MRIALSSLLLVASLFMCAGRAEAWCRSTTIDAPGGVCSTEGIPLWWARRCTSYGFYDEWSKSLAPADIREVFSRSFASWTNISCPDGHPITFEAHQLEETTTCDHAAAFLNGTNTQTIVFQREWPPLNDPNAFALTSAWNIQETGEIVDVDMEFNEELWTFDICPEAGCTNGHVDLENVVTHEAGHYFGLGHSTVAGATMLRTASAGEVEKRSLEADDIEGICTVYPAGSLPESCDDTPLNGYAANLGCGDQLPETCSCAVPGAHRTSPRDALCVMLGLSALLIARARRRAH